MRHESELNKARLDPASVYHTPFELLDDRKFDTREKLEILRSWEQDAREMAVATEEGMTGGEQTMLPDILEAIHHLQTQTDHPSAPTKQGSHST